MAIKTIYAGNKVEAYIDHFDHSHIAKCILQIELKKALIISAFCMNYDYF